MKKDGADCAAEGLTSPLECWKFINGNKCEECGQRLPKEKGDKAEKKDDKKDGKKDDKKDDKKKATPPPS